MTFDNINDRPFIPMGVAGDCAAEWEGFACTRDAGHRGIHAAHGSDPQRPVAAWNDAIFDGPALLNALVEEPALEECADCRGGCCGSDEVSAAYEEMVQAVNNYLTVAGLALNAKELDIAISWDEEEEG